MNRRVFFVLTWPLVTLAASPVFAQSADAPPPSTQQTVVVQTSGGSAPTSMTVATTTTTTTTTEATPCSSCDEADHASKEERVTDRLGIIGFRTGATHAGGDGTAVGFAFAGRSAEYSDISLANSRETLFWVLGGGGAGFEGALGGSLAGGYRVPFDKAQGAVLRIGLEGYILGNQRLYTSMFEIPQGQLAYQFLQGNTLFEIGGKAGAVLTGRFRDPTIDATRKFPLSAEWGGYASLHFTPFRVDASFTRVEARSDDLGTPIDLVDGAVCSLAGPFSLCADGRYQRGDIALADGTGKNFQSYYGGVTVGFGWRPEKKQHKHPAGTTTARAY